MLSWMMRGSAAPSIFPKRFTPLATLFTGPEKFGVLNALKNSARNALETFSCIRNDFEAERSKLTLPGPVNRFRDAVPNVPAAAGAKAAVLKYPEIKSA